MPDGAGASHDHTSDRSPRRRLYTIAVRCLSRRSLSEQQLVERLRRRGASVRESAAVIDALRQQGYVNDRDTAVQWLVSWRRHKGWGPVRIRAELLRRGISRSLTEELLREQYPDDEAEAAAMVVAQRLITRSVFRRAGRQNARRLATQLSRYGFAGSTVQRVVPRFCWSGTDKRYSPP